MSQTPKASTKSSIALRIVSSPGPINRLRAGNFGLDKLRGKRPALELYYAAGDPHSHLAAQWLRQNMDRLQLEVLIRLVGDSESLLYPEADKQRAFALEDAKQIAAAYGLSFSSDYRTPSAEQCLHAARSLMHCSNTQDFLQREASVATALFHGDNNAIKPAADSQTTQQHLAHNSQRRARLGHYLPGMWQLQGRWYWGVDRMHHLHTHLQQLDALQGDQPLITLDPTQATLPARQADETLEFYFSFRSPYSYLAAVALQQQRDELPVPLRIRPVLPMAMRGLKVPSRKRLYIARDVKREADALGIAFGRIADPLGDGALRCLTAVTLARDTKQTLDFLVSASRTVWSQGIDVARDDGLRYACEQAGLDWPAVTQKLAQGFDLDAAEQNRQALFDAGLWGVPSYRCGALTTWGRDRWWLMQEYLRRPPAAGVPKA